MSRLRRPRGSLGNAVVSDWAFNGGGRGRVSGCASDSKRGRSEEGRREFDDVDVDVDVAAASYLPRECSPENTPLASCGRSGPSRARAAQRRACRVAAETRSRRLPWQDVLSVREDNLRWGRDPRRTCTPSSSLSQGLLRTQRASSRATLLLSFSLCLCLSYVPSRDSTNARRRRRRSASPATLSRALAPTPSSRRPYSRERAGEKERNDHGRRGVWSINRGHRGANSCFGMSQHNVVAHVVPDVIRVSRAYVPRPEARQARLAAVLVISRDVSSCLACGYCPADSRRGSPPLPPECI